MSPNIKKLSAFFDGRYDLTDSIEVFATAMFSDTQSDSRSNVLFFDGIVGNQSGTAATFFTRGFTEAETGIAGFENDQQMWTATIGAKGGLDVADDTWYWDVAYSHAEYNMTSVSTNLKEEGVRNWILSGASSVTDHPDQNYTYFVNDGFYNARLLDNIVRPVSPSDIEALLGRNVLKGKAKSQSLTLTLNGTLGDFGIFYNPVKFAARTELARQRTEIIPDERTLNTTGQGWYNIGALQSEGIRTRKALALELDVPVLHNLNVFARRPYGPL